MIVDPLLSAERKIQKNTLNEGGSCLAVEPLRSWLLGLAERKARFGARFPWADIRAILIESARAVVDADSPPMIKVGAAAPRPPTASEIDNLRAFLSKPVKQRAFQAYLSHEHPDLWARLRLSANGRGDA